jgi:3',5'-cyclic AMP phosphodiesterase CpdA
LPSVTRFLFFADPQLGCYASFSGLTEADLPRFAARGMRVTPAPRVEGFEWDARRYALAIEEANRLQPDFVMIGGDMVDDANDDAQLAEFFRISKSLDPSVPLHWAPGNHDAAGDGVVPTTASLTRYREIFGADYYAIDLPEAKLVVMNTVVAAHPERVPGEWEAQLGFLRGAFAEADVDGRRLVLIGHHPLFVTERNEPDSYWNIPGERRAVLLDLLDGHTAGITAFAGHLHRNAPAREGSIELVTSGPVGYPLGDDPSGYRVVEVSEQAVTHHYVPLPIDG